MTDEGGEIELSAEDLRVVARYAAESAEETLAIFEASDPGDRRPREALEAAWSFVDGARRTKLQRVTALAANKAGQEATTEAAQNAARAAGHAAAAALPRRSVERKPCHRTHDRVGYLTAIALIALRGNPPNT